MTLCSKYTRALISQFFFQDLYRYNQLEQSEEAREEAREETGWKEIIIYVGNYYLLGRKHQEIIIY